MAEGEAAVEEVAEGEAAMEEEGKDDVEEDGAEEDSAYVFSVNDVGRMIQIDCGDEVLCRSATMITPLNPKP